ncbi:MAG TPA: hypothetical protein VHC72_01780 [Bryobacteraceae bacterium]|nr:hypothetical protein [Bryobacteraceae bacterium]
MMSGKRWLCRALLAAVSAGSLALAQNATAGKAGKADPQQDIANLRALIAAQQKQLDALRHTLDEQQRRLDQAAPAASAPAPLPNRGQVASITPIFPAAAPATLAAIPAIPTPQAAPASASNSNPCEAPPDAKVPAYIRLGDTCVIPVGFMDMTAVWRDKDLGSSIGTNFASIPYNNTLASRLSEFRFSPQNSRLGFRADGNWKGAHFMAYNEFDFNGTSGGNNLSVTSGSFVPRIRLFWVDVRKGGIEFLAGQSWSMMTPNRKGISALPGDIFYSQVIDLNYLTGLPWTRQPGVRLLIHPSDKVTFGFAAENPEQYMGGSSGGGSITLPAALAAYSGGELSNNTNTQAVPNFTPDFMAKVAFDPNNRVHFEVAGIERNFRSYNLATNQRFHTTGGGVSANAIVGVTNNFKLTTTNFWSDGGGRYLFGQAPDVIVRADGSLSPIHSGGFTEGFEQTIKNTLLYGYWGGTYIGRNTAVDANGTSLIGYGYRGSANGQNRMIQEVTFGFNQTFWKNPRYGAANFMGQYIWESRSPWSYLANQPGGKGTHMNTLYFNIRYTLPGSMPSF